jgi:NMD protein affecting ribosome stability and mRNA decay
MTTFCHICGKDTSKTKSVAGHQLCDGCLKSCQDTAEKLHGNRQALPLIIEALFQGSFTTKKHA